MLRFFPDLAQRKAATPDKVLPRLRFVHQQYPLKNGLVVLVLILSSPCNPLSPTGSSFSFPCRLASNDWS